MQFLWFGIWWYWWQCCGPGVCPAQILNPSFEATFTAPGPRLVPSHWGRVENTSFNSDCGNGWSTDGALSARLYSRTGRTFAPGAYQSFWQLVDLTEVGAIAFDVRLVASPSGVFEHFEASFWVGGVPLWNCTDGGVYLDQTVDVSQVTGWKIIELRMTALASGPFPISYWTQWDNLRVLAVLAATDPGPIEAFVGLEPNTLNLASQGKWITCYIALEEGYDVTEIDGSTVALEDIPAHLGREGWASAGGQRGEHPGSGRQRISGAHGQVRPGRRPGYRAAARGRGEGHGSASRRHMV
jgi:hypothetical protein